MLTTHLEWASGDSSTPIEWEYGTTPQNTSYHKVSRQTQLLWSEIGDRAEWGNWYWATKETSGYSYQSGSNTTLRSEFAQNGSLSNSQDADFRAINDDFPTFAFAKDFGNISNQTESTLFTIGLCQDSAIQFDSAVGNVSVPSLWTAYFATDLDAVSGCCRYVCCY